MKPKEIIMLIGAVLVMGVSGFFIYKMVAPQKTQEVVTPQEEGYKITGEIDEEILKDITSKKDYGEATLENIGRTNPFGPLN